VKLVRSLLTFLLTLAVLTSDALAQRQSMTEYQLRELRDAVKGIVLSQEQSSNLWEIYRQLNEYSGELFPIVLGQTFQWGQAHAGGVIIFDRSIAAKPKDVAAFVMAHEYGHQVLGHQPNFYKPFGSVWRFRPSATSDEDAADAWAGEFLARYDYDICAVAKFLERTPRSPNSDTHSDGPERAQNVKSAADVEGCESAAPAKSNNITFTVEIDAIQVGALGAKVEVWIDDKRVGEVNNMDDNTSIEVKDFTEGRHTWRLRARVYKFISYTPMYSHNLVGSGSATFNDGDTFLIKGYATNMTLEKQ